MKFSLVFLALAICGLSACTEEKPQAPIEQSKRVVLSDWQVQKVLDGVDAQQLVETAKAYLSKRLPEFSLEGMHSVAMNSRDSIDPIDRQRNGDNWQVDFFEPNVVVDGVKWYTLGGGATVYIDKASLVATDVWRSQ